MMFYECSSLSTLDLSSFNTRNVTNMQKLFYNCSSLTKLDLSSFKVDNADIRYMFSGCKNLISCANTDTKIERALKEK